MQIFLKQPNGRTATIEISENDDIGSIKLKIQDKFYIPPKSQCLIFNGKTLDNDNAKAKDCLIQDKATITVVEKAAGKNSKKLLP